MSDVRIEDIPDDKGLKKQEMADVKGGTLNFGPQGAGGGGGAGKASVPFLKGNADGTNELIGLL